jgi:flagellar basal body-associated protein FliL
VNKLNLSKEKIFRLLFTVLVSIAGALIAILIAGTIYGIARPRGAEPVLRLGNTNQAEQVFSQTDDIRVFSGLGRMRIPLANSSVLILSIAFPYDDNDAAFSEELAAKVNDLRAISTDYFSSLPAERLIQLDEEAAKQEILRRFNTNLRLGRIEALYFSDMVFIDAP